MRRILLLAALASVAGCASQPQAPAHPQDSQQAQAFSTYLSARFAAADHDLPQAAHYYSTALANDPADPQLLALSFFLLGPLFLWFARDTTRRELTDFVGQRN